jgi:non-lysosomal glucosylceramidase
MNELSRRDFVRVVGAGSAAMLWARLPVMAGPFDGTELIPADKKLRPEWVKSLFERGAPTIYRGAELEKIGMPIGGICAGQLYLGGDGRLWHWDIFNLPQAGNFVSTNGPNYANPPKPHFPIEQGFSIRIGDKARTLDSRGFADVQFRGQYPMAFVDYRADDCPVTVALEAFTPYCPLNVADSSLRRSRSR